MASLYSDEASSSTENKTADFRPRAYQLELYEHAKKQNSILVLGTGSGKTFISILLIKDLGYQIRKSLKENRKWTVFVVNTVPLVYQQGHAIHKHTAFNVGMFERSRGVDIWTDEDEIKKMEDGGRKSCYNPWTQHEVSDKSVADSVEALIGISLLVGGRETAMNFLGNLGMEIYNGTSFQCSLPVPSALLSKEEWANEEVLRYYDKYCLDRLEEKIQYTFRDKSFIVQATTHSSFCQNKVTDCYQRLEFLGDAILDYLVTGMVFSSHVHCTPGQMSDLRSYYVKNETLARAAVKKNLQCHLLYLAPKLQASIDKFISLFQNGLDDDDEIFTEDDAVDLEDVEVPKALGDLIEAIIGAVYLDSGKSLQRAWDVVQVLMGDIIEETMKKKDIPMNCVRKLYEMVPTGIRFDKLPFQEDDGKAMYKLEIPGLPPLIRSGKNYDVAKIVAAKAGLRLLKEKEERGF